jgi:hypothetical protein
LIGFNRFLIWDLADWQIDQKPWRRGIVDIASAYTKEDPGFESRQGERFLGIINCSAVVIT